MLKGEPFFAMARPSFFVEFLFQPFRITGRCLTFFPTFRRSSAKTISGVRSKNPIPFFQLIPQRQCCKPMNCCFIFRPQFGQILLLALIACSLCLSSVPLTINWFEYTTSATEMPPAPILLQKGDMPITITRIIPMHINKDKTVLQSLSARLDYACNPHTADAGLIFCDDVSFFSSSTLNCPFLKYPM